MSDLVQIIKKIALEAIVEREPSGLLYGTVSSVKPLVISVDQKLRLTREFLTLGSNVRDTQLTVQEENGEERKQYYKNSLKKGEKVILLKQQGGQSFLVLDRVEGGGA